ncbi:MAG: hypothetical protein ACHP85_23840, partial [Burkholderiales bacterium]
RPFSVSGARFALDASGTRLDGRVASPRGARLRTGPTLLTAPGQPGSIEQGKQDQRGYELVVEPPASTRTFEIDVSFELAPP